MPDSLPPLNALRAFHAAARHLSFTRAARELFVTHGAVSRQVKNLEEFLGKPLFVRHPRKLSLTRAGAHYAECVADALQQIRRGTEFLLSENLPERLCVSVIPSFASHWLVPRLDRFKQAHPHLELLIEASLDLVDFAKDEIDIGVRFGRGRWPGLHADFLFAPEFFPVCAPSLMEGEHALNCPDSLGHHPLLHSFSRDRWQSWLTMAGVKGVDPSKGAIFNDLNVALQAAIEGYGVVLANSQLVEVELRSGRLVKPFNLSLSEDVAYYVVCAAFRVEEPKIRSVRAWFLKEAAQPLGITALEPKGGPGSTGN